MTMKNGNNYRLSLRCEELVLINNALNEVCHGFSITSFEEKIGISRDQAKELLARVNSQIEMHDSPDD